MKFDVDLDHHDFFEMIFFGEGGWGVGCCSCVDTVVEKISGMMMVFP